MSSKGHILVVDDEVDTVTLIELTLKQLGYTVEPATSGEDALKKVESNHFDVVLLDIMMPEVSGFEVLSKLRASSKPVPPVVILTARGRAEDRERGKILGATAYLIKPVTRGELGDTLKKAMGGPSVPNAGA